MARPKKNDSPPPGAPAWMSTYGDMITLVLCFFILLFAFSSMDSLKWKQAAASLKGSLGVLDGGETLNDTELVKQGNDEDSTIKDREVSEIFEKLQQENQELQRIGELLKEKLEAQDSGIIVEIAERGVIIRFQDSVLFDKGKADIKLEAKRILYGVSDELSILDRSYRIEGHTDDLPIHTVKYPSNWELSTSRATNVLRYLIEIGDIDPGKLSAVGYGEYHPVAENVDEESREKNRRVDIIVLKKELEIQ